MTNRTMICKLPRKQPKTALSYYKFLKMQIARSRETFLLQILITEYYRCSAFLIEKKYWASVLKESLTNQIQENITEGTIFET